MAEIMSPNVQLDEVSSEKVTISKVQDEEFPFLTPEPKLSSQKHDYPTYTSEIFLSSSSGSSDISTKESSETFSSSPSSDAESFTYDHHLNGNENLQLKIIDFDIDSNTIEENFHLVKEDMLEETKYVLHEKLLEKLEITTKKLKSSEEEIAKLKHENLTLVEELGKTIEKLQMSEKDLANQSIDLLKGELGSERRVIVELQEIINKTTNDLSNYGGEVEELKIALHDAQKDFSKDRLLFQKEITSLNEEKFGLELRNELLEEKMKQYEIEKIEGLKLQEARETDFLKSLNTNKLKNDILMAERDDVFSKMKNLAAELNAQDNIMSQMKEQISKLGLEHMELLNESDKTNKIVEELRVKVIDQEKELEKQRVINYDNANEKREAIRQLCFSLEYYRNEYHQLRQLFSKYKRC